MDKLKKARLIRRLKEKGMPSYDKPLPIVELEDFFDGNDDNDSIGVNTDINNHDFYNCLRKIRNKANVQNVLVEIFEAHETDESRWPFSERVYIIANSTKQEVNKWFEILEYDAIEDGWFEEPPSDAPEILPGYKVYGVWWD